MAGYVRADVRREQLLVAARTVLIRDGLDGLTLRGVADEAGVHLSALQYIFKSRAELVTALVDRVLTDSSYGQFEAGDGGLQDELTRQVAWFDQQFLADAALLEVLRHEYVVAVSRIDPSATGSQPHPASLLPPTDYPGLIAGIGRQAGETYVRSPAELGRLWGLGMAGLLVEYLAHRDRAQFRGTAELLVAALVALAQPGAFNPSAPAPPTS